MNHLLRLFIRCQLALVFSLALPRAATASDSCAALSDQDVIQSISANLDFWKPVVLGPFTTGTVSLSGKIFRRHIVSATSMQKYQGDDSLAAILQAESYWYAPVLVNGTAEGFLFVDCAAGAPKITGYGAKAFAEKMQRLGLINGNGRIAEIVGQSQIIVLVESSAGSYVYPLFDYAGQYANIPQAADGAYKGSNFFLALSGTFLASANAVRISPSLDIDIPYALYESPDGSTGMGRALALQLKYVPESGGRYLFELSGYQDIK